MSEFIIGVYKEVGKVPDLKKVKNTKEDLELLVGGEIATVKYDDYVIIYKKNSDSLLGNVCLDVKGYGLDLSLKGTIFVANQDENGEFKSLNKQQALKSTGVLISKSFNYKNFDEKGRYLTKSQRRKRNNKRNNNTKSNLSQFEFQKQALGASNSLFENNFRLERIETTDKKQQDTRKSNEIEQKEISKTNSITIPLGENDKGKLILERTLDSSTSVESENSNISLSDESVLKMILKIQFIILDFINNAMGNNDE